MVNKHPRSHRRSLNSQILLVGKTRATQHDVLGTYGPLIKNASILLNADISPQEGEELIKAGKISGVELGWVWIGTPDVVSRLQNGKELNYNVAIHRLYGGDGTGYTDYPFA